MEHLLMPLMWCFLKLSSSSQRAGHNLSRKTSFCNGTNGNHAFKTRLVIKHSLSFEPLWSIFHLGKPAILELNWYCFRRAHNCLLLAWFHVPIQRAYSLDLCVYRCSKSLINCWKLTHLIHETNWQIKNDTMKSKWITTE